MVSKQRALTRSIRSGAAGSSRAWTPNSAASKSGLFQCLLCLLCVCFCLLNENARRSGHTYHTLLAQLVIARVLWSQSVLRGWSRWPFCAWLGFCLLWLLALIICMAMLRFHYTGKRRGFIAHNVARSHFPPFYAVDVLVAILVTALAMGNRPLVKFGVKRLYKPPRPVNFNDF